MKAFLERLFGIEEGEGRAVGLSLLQAVLLGVPRLFTLAVGAALFLERYSADNVPWVYIAASAVLPAAGLLHLSTGRRVSFVRLQLGTLLVLAAVPIGFIVLLRSTAAAWPAFALFVWCGAELHLSNIVLWSTANRMFTVRQGKRLYGLIGAGEILAAIGGGAALPALARLVGTVDLLAVSAVGFLLTFLVLLVTARAFRDRLAHRPGRDDAARDRGRDVLSALRDRFLLLIFLTYAAVLSAGFVANSIFYFQVRETFPSAAAVAVFLARFTAVSSVLALVFRSLLSGRFLRRFGLVGGLVATPAALLLASLVVLHFGRTGSSTPALFWSVVALRLVERLSLGALGQPAYYSLYQPLSRQRRARVQTAAETIAGPVVGGATGTVLLFLTKGLSLSAVGLTAAFLPLLLAWLVVGVAVGRAFPAALTTALRRRGVAGADLSVTDAASLRVIERGLESPRPAEVLHCLRLMEEAEHPRLRDVLLRLVRHPDPAVRTGAFAAIERSPGAHWVTPLGERLGLEEGASRGALLRALGASGGTEVRNLLEEAFSSSDPEAREGALVSLVRYAGVGPDHPASFDLARLGGSGHVPERVCAARLLGEVGAERAAGPLAALLADDAPEVRHAAIRSAGRLGDARLLEIVVRSLEVPGDRAEASRALAASPEAASVALVEACQAAGSSNALRHLALQALGRSREEAATRFLVGELAFSERQVLSDVLWSLHLRGYRAEGPDRGLVERCLRGEVERGDALVSARRDLKDEPAAGLLVAALGQEIARTQRRVLLLLSFTCDAEALLRIWSNIGDSPALRDLALELFESRVDRAHARLALPLLAEVATRSAAPAGEHLLRFCADVRPRPGSWIRACAVDALAARPEPVPDGLREALASDRDALVRETALARQARGPGPSPLPVVDRVRVLRAAGLFRDIDDEVLAELAPRLEEVAIDGGGTVLPGGDGERSVYVVRDGSLELESEGGEATRLNEGDTFGELQALGADAFAERATALERTTLLRLGGSDLRDLMSTRVEVAKGIIGVLCTRARSASTGQMGTAGAGRPRAADSAAPGALEGEPLSPLDKVLVLRTAELFAEVSDEVLAEVAGRTHEVRLRRNEILFRKGDPGTTTYVVAGGRLRVHVGDRLLAEAGERSVVGELAALSSEPRTASVTAAEDSLLLSLDQESLFDLMLDRQEFARGIIRVLVGRLRTFRVAGSASEAIHDGGDPSRTGKLDAPVGAACRGAEPGDQSRGRAEGKE